MHPRIKHKYVKNLLTKTLLKILYIDKETGIFEIAKKYNLSCDTIKKYLLLHGIDLREKNDWSKILTKDFLKKEYIINQKSSTTIGLENNIEISNIIRYLKIHKIPIRSSSESRTLFYKNNPHATTGINNGMYGMTGSKNPAYKKGLPKCKDCGKTLGDYNSIRCKICNGKHKTIHGMGYLPYPKAFNKQLKQEIRERDNLTCQCCQMTEEEHIMKFNRKLSIHHIDYNKENCKEDNLITTCNKCNTKANYNRDYWFAYYTYKMEEQNNG